MGESGMTVQAFQNDPAEKSILALLATDADAGKYIPELLTDDFACEAHQKLFAVMQRLYIDKRPIDLLAISDAAKSMYGGDEEARLTERLVGIITENQFGAAWAVKSHLEILKATAMRRRMLSVLDKARADLLDATNDTAVVLDTTRQALRDMVTTRHSWESLGDVVVAAYAALQRRIAGEEKSMPSGVSSLDRATTGFHKGELTILGARPAVGKSALGAYIALSTAAQGYSVAICSREMTDVQYGTRILASRSNVDANKLRTGKDITDEDFDAIGDALSACGALSKNVSFMFSTRYIEDLRMEVQKQVDTGKLDMLVIDYTQLMQTKQRFEKDYLRVGYISKMLKGMTVDYNIAILALSQVGRSSAGTMPTLAELRGSGDLEQDADNVIFLHRPEDADDRYVRPADRELFEAVKQQGMQYVVIDIAKQRQGQTGAIPVIFDPARMRYMAIDRSEGK